MADHRAEQIMDAMETLLTGLTTTGTNIKRDRVYPWDTLPAISLFQGDDTPIPYDQRNFEIDDYLLDVHIEMHVSEANSVAVSQTLNLIRKETIIAIQADITLGLSFVIDCYEGTAYRPQIDYTDKVIATQVFDLHVKYRRSRTDPSA